VTDEEIARFALVLSEADGIRAQIEQDEAAARTAGGRELSSPTAPSGVEWISMPAAAAAA
jgi:hypothetical protein